MVLSGGGQISPGGDSAYQFQAIYTNQILVTETSAAIFLRNNATQQNVFSLTDSGSSAGTLPTGDYTLSILIQGNSGGALFGDSRTQIDATLSIPAPSLGACVLIGGVAEMRRRRERS